MSSHLMKSVDDICCNTAGMCKGDPLRPEVTRNSVRRNRYLREDALEELASTVVPSTLNL